MMERRFHPRYPARWRVTLYCQCQWDRQQKIFDGITSDVSLGGMCVYCDHHLCAAREVDLILSIPSLHAGGAPHRLAIRARASHTVLVGELDVFRIGMQFLHMREADRQCLRHHLNVRFGCYALTPPAQHGEPRSA